MIELIYLLLVVSSLILGLRDKFNLIPCALFVNICTDAVTLYSDTFALSPGTIRLLSLVILLIRYSPLLRRRMSFVVVLCYLTALLFIGMLNTSNHLVSFEGILKLTVPLFFFPVSQDITRTYPRRCSSSLYKGVLISSFLILTALLVAQLFQLGESPYIEDFFFLGGFNIQITYSMAYFLIILLYSTTQKSRSERIIVIGLTSLLCVAVILVFRRAAIVSVAFSLLMYFISRGQRLILLISLSFIGIVGYLAIGQLFPSISEVVDKRGENHIEDEGRFLEFNTIVEDLNFYNSSDWIFGKELFNSRDYFSKKSAVKLRNQTQLHTDLATLLHGSGIFGLILYLLVISHLFLQVFRSQTINRFLFPTLPTFVAFLLFSISGQYYIMSALTTLAIMLGVFSTLNTLENKLE